MNRILKTISFSTMMLWASSCIIPLGGATVGDLRVTWSFGGKQRCAEVGVEDVIVQLIEQGKEGKGGKAFGETANCIEGSIVLPDVVAGKYVMVATGTGEEAIFNNGKGVEVEVFPNQLTDVDAPMQLANGAVVSRIEFQYQFPNNQVCNDVGVRNINATVIDENGIQIAGATADCVAGIVAVDGIRVGEHTLRIDAVDAEDRVRFRATRPLTGLQAGETLRIDPIPLEVVTSTVRVGFLFQGEASCTAAGVTTVEATMINSDGEVVAGGNVNCSDGRILLQAVPVGTHQLQLTGLDAGQAIQFRSARVSVAVTQATQDAGVVNLTGVNSSVVVRFALPTGESCASMAIGNVDVRVVGANTVGTSVACTAGEIRVTGASPGNGNIFVEALSGDFVVLSGTQAVTLLPGSTTAPQTVTLAPVRTRLEVTWGFNMVIDNNVQDAVAPQTVFTSSCSDARVDTVLVRVFRGQGQAAQLVASAESACNVGTVAVPNVPIAGGNVRVVVEGLRQQEGDSIFLVANDNLALTGVRTPFNAVLAPSVVFARVIWSGDCGTAQSATVDVRVTAAGLSQGVSLPCADGTTNIALPAGSEGAPVTISVRGVGAQGEVRGGQTIPNINVVPGIAVFRFTAPTLN